MRTLVTLLTLVCAVALGATPAAAQARRGGQQGGAQIPQIKSELQLMMLELDGDFGMSAAGGPMPSVDMTSDIDLDDELWAWALRASIGDIRMGWLEFGLMRFASRGERFLHRDLQIRGVNFQAGMRVESRLDFRWTELVLGQLYGAGGGYYIGYEVGGADYRYRLRVRSPLDGLHVRVDETPGLPLVGIKLGIGMGQTLLLLGSIRGNFFSFGDLDSNVLESVVELRMAVSTLVLLHVGWRYFRLDANFDLGGADEATTDFYVQGPFVGLEIRFG